MRRDPDLLTSDPFDLLVVGGGALGAFAVWDATLRGLRSALIERADFGSATTAASGRVLHGGLRSLQYVDPAGALESLREQAEIASLAPDLVRPLPFLFPAGPGAKERGLLRTAARVWGSLPRALGFQRDLPPPRFHPSARSLDPDLRSWAPAGGLVVWDLQIGAPERLVFALVQAAAEEGAVVANRIEARETLIRDGRIVGVRAHDFELGADLEIRARLTLNVAGPWASALWRTPDRRRHPIGFASGIHLVTTLAAPTAALGLDWRDDSDSGRLLCGRRIFAMPWEDRTLIGATWRPIEGPPDPVIRPLAEEIGAFAEGLQARWPALGLEPDHVRFATAGLYPVFGVSKVPLTTYAASRSPLIVDHATEGGPAGLLTAIGVKLTTARRVAETLVDLVARRLSDDGVQCGPCVTRNAGPLPGASSGPAHRSRTGRMDAMIAGRFARTAASEEMARSLADIFLRRTTEGLRGIPARDVLRSAAAGTGKVLGWAPERQLAEVADFEAVYEQMGIQGNGAED